MKITKQYLNQIIKEETEKILSESFRKAYKAARRAGKRFFNYKGKKYGTKMSTRANWKKRQARRREKNLQDIAAATNMNIEFVRDAHKNMTNNEVGEFGKLARQPAGMPPGKFRQLARSKGGRAEVKPKGAPQDSAEVKAAQKKLAKNKIPELPPMPKRMRQKDSSTAKQRSKLSKSDHEHNVIKIPRADRSKPDLRFRIPPSSVKYNEIAPDNTPEAIRQKAADFLKGRTGRSTRDKADAGPKKTPGQPD